MDADTEAKYHRLREIMAIIWVPLHVESIGIRFGVVSGSITSIILEKFNNSGHRTEEETDAWMEMLDLGHQLPGKFNESEFLSIVFPNESVTVETGENGELIISRESSVASMLEIA